jgi:hypothetical protein
MRLQERDIEIINYLKDYKGGTIDQISTLFFKGSYEAAKRRLRMLVENKEIKSSFHGILNKKVFYTSKLPSYHRLITNDIRILLLKNVELLDFKFEVKIENQRIDAMAVYKRNKLGILIIEVDIYNRTKIEKIEKVKKAIKLKTRIEPVPVIVSMHVRFGDKGIVNMGIGERGNLIKYI